MRETKPTGVVASGIGTLEPAPRWRPATLIAFRFCFLYFSLYMLVACLGLIPLPVGALPDFGVIPPVRNLVFWVATHVFRVTHALVVTDSGSGDKTYDWVQAFCLLVVAVAGSAVWSFLDRGRHHYVNLHKWFRLVARFMLGATIISYGLAKVIPLQMPAPSLATLLEPYGNFSMMGVLWASIGASFSYEIVVGSAELLGGVLLFQPRTTTLGAMVCLVDTVEIFSLNMTYDVPVKLFAFHLILLSLLLLAPEASRLANVLVLNRPAGPSTQPPLLHGRRANRIALAVQGVFGAYLVAMNVYGSLQGWTQYGPGAPKSPLYGIWKVDEMSIDGHTRSPFVTDYGRWRRVVFDFPTSAAFQRMDETFAYYGAVIDMTAKSLTLTKGSDKNWKGNLTFQQRAAEELILDGEMGGHAIHMLLRLQDRKAFQLVRGGFHWIQEYPYNR